MDKMEMERLKNKVDKKKKRPPTTPKLHFLALRKPEGYGARRKKRQKKKNMFKTNKI